MAKMTEIIGVTFPIRKSFIPRFFEDGKTVFVKPATIFKDLQRGLKFIFYQSQKDIGYVGEAIIDQITISEDPLSFFDIYGEDIFLTREELLKYIEDSRKWSRRRRKGEPRSRKWLAIKLVSIKAYDVPIKPKNSMPLGGQYIKK